MSSSLPPSASIPDEDLRCDLLDAVKVDWARKNAILPVMQDGRLVYAGGPSLHFKPADKSRPGTSVPKNSSTGTTKIPSWRNRSPPR